MSATSPGTSSGPTAAVRRTWRPSRTTRRVVLLSHVVTSLGWLGVDAVIGVLAVTGFLSDEPARVAAVYTALDAFAVPTLLVFGFGALTSGVLLGLGSRWGLVRYWWVATKLVLNLVLTGLVLVLLQPRVSQAAAESVRVDASLVDRLGGIPTDLLFPAFVSGVALLLASVLGVFKPWGRTPFGRGRALLRTDRARSGAGVTASR